MKMLALAGSACPTFVLTVINKQLATFWAVKRMVMPGLMSMIPFAPTAALLAQPKCCNATQSMRKRAQQQICLVSFLTASKLLHFAVESATDSSKKDIDSPFFIEFCLQKFNQRLNQCQLH